MIDRAGRNAAASLIRQYVAGRITSEDCENDWPESGADPAVRAMARFMTNFFDDFSVHRFDSKDTSAEGHAALARCLCFLDSDLEYRWPEVSLSRVRRPAAGQWLRGLVYRLFFERSEHREDAALSTYGEVKWWPFRDELEYKTRCPAAHSS